MKQNKTDFNELVWSYGASGTKVFDGLELSKMQKLVIIFAWADVEKKLNPNDEDTTEADKLIDTYYSDFIKAEKE